MMMKMMETWSGVHAYDGNLCIILFIQNIQLQRSEQCLVGHELKVTNSFEWRNTIYQRARLSHPAVHQFNSVSV
jgi:hypothetical protein